MNRGVNKVIIVGNVGNDPDCRTMPNGNSVANISIATSESWKDKATGEPQERTEWHRVVFFKTKADIVAEYVKKGSKLYIEGRLQTRSWEQDGVKRYTTEIIGNEMLMLDRRELGMEAPKPVEEKPKAPTNRDSGGQLHSFEFDDDIPF